MNISDVTGLDAMYDEDFNVKREALSEYLNVVEGLFPPLKGGTERDASLRGYLRQLEEFTNRNGQLRGVGVVAGRHGLQATVLKAA